MTDILAIINILMGLAVVILYWSLFLKATRNRWVYLFFVVAGFGLAMMYFIAIMSDNGLVPPLLGRPVLIVVQGALVIGGILDFKRGGI